MDQDSPNERQQKDDPGLRRRLFRPAPPSGPVRLRCPYCGYEFQGAARSICPSCKKGIIVPDRHRSEEFLRKKRAKERIARDAERKRVEMGLGVPDGLLHRKPAHIFFVVAILAVVGGLLASRAGKPQTWAPAKPNPALTAMREVDILAVALEQFKRDCYRYPTTQNGIVALVRNPGYIAWGGPYVTLTKNDPWKRPYVYRSEQFDQRTLLSLGPDGAEGTADDILPDENYVRDYMAGIATAALRAPGGTGAPPVTADTPAAATGSPPDSAAAAPSDNEAGAAP